MATIEDTGRKWTMRLAGGVEGVEQYPELVEHIGNYVTRYEPENARKGEQWLWTSPDVEEAMTFEDVGDLHALYAKAVGTRPWDGKPDRPLTVFHIEVKQNG